MPTAITVVFTDLTVEEIISNMDDESIRYWARNKVEYNDNIKQIIVDFDEGRMIFEAIN